MNASSKNGSIPHIEVEDPTVAMQKAGELWRRVMNVPKVARGKKAAKKKRKSR